MSRLVVIDLHSQAYDEESLLYTPLGGSQSSVIETCASLAQELDTTLYNSSSGDRRSGALRIRSRSRVPAADLAGADWLAIVGSVPPELLARIPRREGRPRLALWAHHDFNQPAVQSLAQESVRARIDRYLFVSNWQRDRYCRQFSIDPAATAVLGNPYCARALERAGPAAKRYDRPLLAYASTPFRGLQVLADAFPAFAKRYPEAKLVVLSGMILYGESDEGRHQGLLDRLARMPGVKLEKPVGKLRLYEILRGANVLAYPSTFPETFCIAALEARVLGNALWLTRTGALPEVYPDAEFHTGAGPNVTSDEWASFMVESWERLANAPPTEALARAAETYRRTYAPSAVAGRLWRALFE